MASLIKSLTLADNETLSFFRQKPDILVKQIVQDYIYTWILRRHNLFLQLKLILSVTMVTHHVRHVKLKTP